MKDFLMKGLQNATTADTPSKVAQRESNKVPGNKLTFNSVQVPWLAHHLQLDQIKGGQPALQGDLICCCRANEPPINLPLRPR
jgi:hypothetical protein